MSVKAEALPSIRKGKFSYGSNGLTVKNCKKVDITDLRKLLFHNELKGKRAQQKAAEDARGLIKKDWLSAQLTHYGLEHNVKMTCNQVPPHIHQLEVKLADEYSTKNTLHVASEEKRVKSLESERERSNREHFASLATSTAEANWDQDLFLQKYFLNADRLPDRSKTPTPMILPHLSNRMSLHVAAERIGLATLSGGKGDARTLVIGWDKNAVFREAYRIDHEQAAQKEQVKDESWEEDMDEHHEFVKSLPASSHRQVFSINHAEGEYLVKCENIESNYTPDSMTMNITYSEGEGWVAMFDFGVIEGMMIFDTDKGRLQERWLQGKEIEDRGSEDDEDEDSFEASSCGHTFSGRKRKGPPNPFSKQGSKRPKKSTGNSDRCLFLKWRGDETGEGEIQLDTGDCNSGSIEYLDPACTRFKGTFSADLLGEDVPFQGFKISSDGGSVIKSWGDYSESAYERARVRRWG
ncbi:MAG: hypothetical protein Q9164_006862 [Protoblastenia rupestris]